MAQILCEQSLLIPQMVKRLQVMFIITKGWKEGKYCDLSQNQFRQHPLDHIEGVEITIKAVLKESNIDPAHVKGICIA